LRASRVILVAKTYFSEKGLGEHFEMNPSR
jgi:hypothetical protein